MANPLLDKLREGDKHGLFDQTQTSVSYNTGFLPFDYKNGYMIQVRDLNDMLITEYPATGLVSGSFTTIIGKTGTAKTTFAVQAAANIVRKFNSGTVMHYDLEQALTYTRIRNITGMKMSELTDKYILKQEKNYIEDITEAIMKICNTKDSNKSEFMYDTGMVNEFNNPIKLYVPTVIIVDSIPTIASKEISKDELEGQTHKMRMVGILTQWYAKLTPIIKAYNIMIITINHIKSKIEINPFAKTQPQLMYLKVDESLPGGAAAIYYAHQLLKFVSIGKCNADDDGFDGFRVRCELLKSRTNKAGQSCNLTYFQETGFDPITTQLDLADEFGCIDGRAPKKFFKGFDDVKFNMKKFKKEFNEREEVRKALFDTTVPILEKQLSRARDEDAYTIDPDEVLKRLILSQ